MTERQRQLLFGSFALHRCLLSATKDTRKGLYHNATKKTSSWWNLQTNHTASMLPMSLTMNFHAGAVVGVATSDHAGLALGWHRHRQRGVCSGII